MSVSKITVYHGYGSSQWWKWSLKNCQNILLPYNYVVDSKVPQYVLEGLQNKQWILDSGAARYFLNNGYAEFPFSVDSYLEFVQQWQPTFFASMDYATERIVQKIKPKKLEKYSEIFYHWIDRTLEKNYILFDKWVSLGLQSELIPIVQGFNEHSYIYCAEEMRDLVRSSQIFGIGSVCRAKVQKLKATLKAIRPILDLSKAHLFGQSIRTLPTLHEFGIKSVDTSNAMTNAGFHVYQGTNGTLFYGKQSNKKRKHRLDDLSYPELFSRNKQSHEAVASGDFGLWKYLESKEGDLS